MRGIAFAISLVIAIILSGACDSKPLANTDVQIDQPDGNVALQELLLRFAPQVGQTYEYAYSVNLGKKTFNKPRNEKLNAVISLSVLDKDADTYRVRMGAHITSSDLGRNARAMVEDKAAKFDEVAVSDRFVFDRRGTQNLCFPEEPVKPGDTWEGEYLFTFGDLATVDPPMIRASYKFIDLEQREDGRYCTIECMPITKQFQVPLQIGQLGLQCDTEGRVIAVRRGSGAEGKIRVRDLLVGLRGQKATTAAERNKQYERFVEPLEDTDTDVPVTFWRNGKEHTVDVAKSVQAMGTMRVEITECLREVLFTLDKGVICSDTTSCVLSVTYDLTSVLPFVDDFTGSKRIERIAQRQIPPRIYNYEWKQELMP